MKSSLCDTGEATQNSRMSLTHFHMGHKTSDSWISVFNKGPLLQRITTQCYRAACVCVFVSVRVNVCVCVCEREREREGHSRGKCVTLKAPFNP